MSFRNVSLNRHNFHRANHRAPPLQWNNQCEAHAKRWAEHLLASNTFGHSNDRDDMGENIWCYYMTRGKLMKTDDEMALEAIDAWYAEVKKYSFMRPGFSKKTGHFSALVWIQTNYVGMSIAKNDERAFICANYTPQGNVETLFKDNVKRKKSKCIIM